MLNESYILITGARGEVGSEFIKAISKESSTQILTLDLHPLESNISRHVHKQIIGSILDDKLLEQIHLDYKIKEIYHLAAILSTKSESSPKVAHNVNVNGMINILELAIKQSEKNGFDVKFFFPSSIAVYGINKNKDVKIYSENQALNPITIYGCNKLYAEKIGIYYSNYYNQLSNIKGSNIDFRAIRLPGLISSRTIPSGGTSDFIPEMWHSIVNTNHYECFVDSNSRLPFLAMPDAINGIMKLMNTKKSDIQSKIYNITSFNVSVSEFFSQIKLHFSNATISYNVHSTRQKIVDSWPDDIDDLLAQKEWKWAPQLNLNNIFHDYLLNMTHKQSGTNQ